MGTRALKPRERVLAYLADRIESTRGAGTTRLPTVKQIAAHVGVSTVTVMRALAPLKREGVLEATQRKGADANGEATQRGRRTEGL